MLKIYVANLGKYNEGELVGKWINLPATEDGFEKLLEDIGIGDERNDGGIYEEYEIHDFECNYDIRLEDLPSDLDELNELAERIENAEGDDAFNALVEACDSMEEALDAYEENDYMFYPGVTDEEELGEYIVNEGLFAVDIPDELINYIDYEAIGRDHYLGSTGSFTSEGYIEMY